MQNVVLKDFGKVISDSELGREILQEVQKSLDMASNISIDFDGVISMATFCSKQIFGYLYVTLTPKIFFERIKILNASEDMRVIVRLGIEKALEDQVTK